MFSHVTKLGFELLLIDEYLYMCRPYSWGCPLSSAYYLGVDRTWCGRRVTLTKNIKDATKKTDVHHSSHSNRKNHIVSRQSIYSCSVLFLNVNTNQAIVMKL